MTENKRVVVGVDGSYVSWRAADWAYREAAYRNMALDIVHTTGSGHPGTDRVADFVAMEVVPSALIPWTDRQTDSRLLAQDRPGVGRQGDVADPGARGGVDVGQ